MPDVTREAMTRLLEHAEKVGLANTDECTFRALFMATAHDLLDEPRFQTEWRRFDLLVQVGDSATAVEFKYYVLRRTLGLRGEFLGYKGGAGPKNEEEFRDCVHKLRAQRLRTIHGGDLGPVRDDVLAADLLTYGVPWPRVGKPPRRSGYVRTQ